MKIIQALIGLLFVLAVVSKIFSTYYLNKAISALDMAKDKNITFKKLRQIYNTSNNEVLRGYIRKTLLFNKISGVFLILIIVTMFICWVCLLTSIYKL